MSSLINVNLYYNNFLIKQHSNNVSVIIILGKKILNFTHFVGTVDFISYFRLFCFLTESEYYFNKVFFVQ